MHISKLTEGKTDGQITIFIYRIFKKGLLFEFLEKYIKCMVGTQLYIIITQISTYNYTFRPCILANVRLYYKLNK
jgi:hypothetical protein